MVAAAVAKDEDWRGKLDKAAWTSLLYRDAWKDAYLASAQRAWDEGFGAAKKEFDPDVWATWIERVLAVLRGQAADRIAGIIGTSVRVIQALIDAAAAEGLSSRDISKRIRDEIPDIAKWRADRIARTEVHAALNAGSIQGSRDMLAEVGLTAKKVWISTPDEKTRADHVSVEPVGVDEKFDVGGDALDYPGDPSAPPGQVINCRCAHALEVDEPEWMQ